MMYTRYQHAADVARGRRVLEVACGSGQGLGLIGREARFVVGGDVDPKLVCAGGAHYRERIPFVRLSAEALPFAAQSFDVILLFEASYYVERLERALDEFARVLTPEGTIVIVNANPERPDFISSPQSHHYHTTDELRSLLKSRSFESQVEGAFRIEEGGLVSRIVSTARTALANVGLVPRTLWARALLKWVVYGRLQKLPPELPEGFAPVAQRWTHGGGPLRNAKVFYVTARRGAAAVAAGSGTLHR